MKRLILKTLLLSFIVVLWSPTVMAGDRGMELPKRNRSLGSIPK